MTAALVADTSALIAIVLDENGADRLALALLAGGARIPAPVAVEFARVIRRRHPHALPRVERLEALMARSEVEHLAFLPDMAVAAVAANITYGSGNMRGGTLNLVDLMVYATARVAGLPILCTGTDFAATDARIHPASRTT